MTMTTPTTETGIVEKVARAMQNADLHDGDEGNHYRLFDLLDFSGENKSVMVTRQLAEAAIAAMPDSTQLLQTMAGALEPFAAFADPYGYIPDEHKITAGSQLAKRQLTMGDLRAAAAALAQFRAQEQRS